MVAFSVAEPPLSERGRRRREGNVLQPIDQIRTQPNGITGAWAYYINPEGATIRDALILYPNGGQPPAVDDPKGKFGTNAAYFRERQARKGFKYIGQRLDQAGVRLLVETMAKNRPDEILYMQEEIADCTRVIENSDRPETRDLYKRRKVAFETRLETLNQPFDADALIEELDEIARAQRLAHIDPNVLAVMRELVGEVNEKTAAMIARFAQGKTSEMDSEMTGVGRITRTKGRGVEDFQGADSLDA